MTHAQIQQMFDLRIVLTHSAIDDAVLFVSIGLRSQHRTDYQRHSE
jgi:hypothetical protein